MAARLRNLSVLAMAVIMTVIVNYAPAHDFPFAPKTTGKPFSDEKQALVDMAKGDKRTGMTTGDMDAYKQLNKAKIGDRYLFST